jgi:hypothetical protein
VKLSPSLKPVDDEAMKDIDMEIKEPVETGAEDFHADDTPAVNIWSLSNHDDNNASSEPRGNNEDEEELDKPSFLRRHLKIGRKPSGKDADKKDDTDTSNKSSDEQGENN